FLFGLGFDTTTQIAVLATSATTVSAKELDQINHWINARPMKTLNWQSPRKVFQQFAVFG
ncbi:hypothetical protein NE281_08570, partial [Leuconostoc mesenteroides]|nr:hypothetical protein [Leuconostoc mesenteroides]